MKQILVIALLCIGFNMAKAQSLRIVNRTPCEVHYVMYGDDPMGNCSANYRSDVYTLGAGLSVTYASPAAVPLPGLVDGGGTQLMSGWFSHVRFPQCNPNFCPGCGTSSVVVGDASCGASTMASHSFYPNCSATACGPVNISYANVGGNVTVTIF